MALEDAFDPSGNLKVNDQAGGGAGSGDLLAANNLSDVDNAATSYDNIKQAASDTAIGAVEKAILAEVNTGTDGDRVITPDTAAGSYLGTKEVQVVAVDFTTEIATGNGQAYFRVPTSMAGMNLVTIAGAVITAATGTGIQTITIQIHNLTQTADMLSTELTIDEDELDSSTAATAAVIDGANDDVADGDMLRIDVDAIPGTTGGSGLLISLGFRLP